MNRKLYEENQQFKERNLEQRQQLENFHVLFQDNQMNTEQTINQMRKERDDSYQRENDLKRRMQHAIDTKKQESFLALNSLKEKLEEYKSNEAELYAEINNLKAQVQQEKSKFDLQEKKFKLLEKECELLKQNLSNEKSDHNDKLTEFNSQLEQSKKIYLNERQLQEEKFARERDEYKFQLGELENKIEEVIKEKAQINYKYGQLIETNRELNNQLQNHHILKEKSEQELKYFIFFFQNFLIYFF
jgi:chromosome segregation ATPase